MQYKEDKKSWKKLLMNFFLSGESLYTLSKLSKMYIIIFTNKLSFIGYFFIMSLFIL